MLKRYYWLLLFVPYFVACSRYVSKPSITESIVRVDTDGGGGTGFVVRAPDGTPLVVTAAHVLSRGGPVRVSRQVSVSDFEHYVESYPEARVVLFDAEADLALLQLRNVPASKLPALELADPVPEEPVASYGFGDSALLGRRLGLTRKDGKLSSVVRLPVVDSLSQRVVKENAVKAIIVSSALEPGFSGGPTLNAAGRVVGINVQKDDSHQAQNACVHASVLRDMLTRLRPSAAPSAADVSALLSTISTDFLQLDTPDRAAVPELTYVTLDELPALQDLAERALQKPFDTLFVFSQIPGPTLPTLTAAHSQAAIDECHKRNKAINNLFREIGVQQSSRCSEYATRPLAWDLIAATLHWDAARPSRYTISKVEEVDPIRRLYRAQVKSDREPTKSFFVHLALEGGTLKLCLFDNALPYALDTNTSLESDDIAGKWTLVSADRAHSEELEIALGADESIEARHTVRHVYNAKRGEVWQCSATPSISYEVRQHFLGKLKAGVALTSAALRDITREGTACHSACNSCTYRPDEHATFKRIGNNLLMTRRDNTATDTATFVRAGDAS